MARPLRIEFPDALYHLTSRGDRGEAIFLSDADRQGFLGVLAQCCERMDAAVYAYCLMDNHYHLVLTTRRANLSRLMRQLNGVYTQTFNRRHDKTGHVFQGRFKAILVDRDAYFLEVCRYVELNPVRAQMVKAPQDWAWSSYRAHTGAAPAPQWLAAHELAAALLGSPADSAAQRRSAAKRYAALVASARDQSLWAVDLKQQIYLGDGGFIERMQAQVPKQALTERSIAATQRKTAKSLDQLLQQCSTRDEALYRAHVEGGMTMTAMAAQVGLTLARVSQLIARYKAAAAAP